MDASQENLRLPSASSFSHPVALITGAGSGIGRAVALMLAREGYRLVLVGRDPARLARVVETIGADAAWAFPADISIEASCTRVIETGISNFGRLDVLINNAGWSPLTPIPEMSAATARRIFDLNALAPVWLTLAASRCFLQQIAGASPPPGGRSPCIVNVSSMASTDPFVGLGVYGAAKAAVNLLTLATARECPGVRAFAVAPGAVETELLRSIISTDALPPERCLSPEDVARVVLDCVLGAYDHQNGRTIEVPSP